MVEPLYDTHVLAEGGRKDCRVRSTCSPPEQCRRRGVPGGSRGPDDCARFDVC